MESTQRMDAASLKLEKIFLWPLIGGATTIFGVLAGFLGAHYDKEIPQSLMLWCPVLFPDNQFAVGPTIFWFCTLLAGCLFTGTFWAQASSSSRATAGLYSATTKVLINTDSLSKKATVLDGLVQRLYTLPPVGFLELYSRTMEFAFASSRGAAESASSSMEVLALSIRTQLAFVLGLAASFDLDGREARYGCNLMLFRLTSKLNSQELADIQNRLLFAEKGVAVGMLPGVLDVIPELSASSDSEGKPDPKLTVFALPIPSIPANEKMNRSMNGVLPGAPDALVAGTGVVIENMDKLKELTETNLFTDFVRKQLATYIAENKFIQSFFAIPLYGPSVGNSKGEPIGILNVHRDRTNPLAADKFQLFYPLLVPLALLIGDLLWTYTNTAPILKSTKEISNG
jgi:hypothetical protein